MLKLMKNNRKRAGLITIFNLPNYGSVLQAYATQMIIESFNYDCLVINYDYQYSDWYKSHTKSRPSWKYKYLGFLGLTKNHRKYKKLQEFCKSHLHLTDHFINGTSLKDQNWSNYNLFISGSDQIWNPRFTYGDPIFMLSFVPDNIKKIAISSSFSCKNIEDKFLGSFKKYLSRFEAISIREINGLSILKNQIKFSKDCAVTLDPTLLVDKQKWFELDSNKFSNIRGQYILIYMMEYAFDPKPIIFDVIQFYERKLGVEAICLEGNIDKATKEKLKIKDLSDSSIEDFISLFRNAAIIVTSSFHGTAFALNFGIPLVSIVPCDGNKDDRQSTIINALHLNNCLCKLNDDLQDLNPFYDKEKEQHELSILRKRSLNWIMSHL